MTLQSKVEMLGRELRDHESPMDEIELDPHVEDDVLRLMFTACHPVLSVDARVALTLRMVAGVSTEANARAFLVQTSAMAARITRAKKTLTAANVPFEVPVGQQLADRLSSVLEAVYLLFNEGYTATAGQQWAGAELRQEAMRLGRMLAALDRAEHIDGTGVYAIQAKIAACHATAARAQDIDWVRIAALWEDLVGLTRSPIVEPNRAVAVSMAD